MRKITILGAIIGSLVGPAVSQADHHWRRIPVAQTAIVNPACDNSTYRVTLTVLNYAHATPAALAAVEQATVDQSAQEQQAWMTPCVRFDSGGNTVTLTSGCSANTCLLGGNHDANGNITVQTGALPYALWARAFTHEVIERLADPHDTPRQFGYYYGLLEIADPVQNWTYLVDGIPVSDFVRPAFYTRAVGPYDAASRLEGPIS